MFAQVLAAWELKTGRKLGREAHEQAVALNHPLSAGVRDDDGSLQHDSAESVDVKLAAGEPAEVGRVPSVEKQNRVAWFARADFENETFLRLPDLGLKPRLLDDVADNVLIGLEGDEFLLTCLEKAHYKLILHPGF